MIIWKSKIELTYAPATLRALLGGVNFHHLMQAYRNGGRLDISELFSISNDEYRTTDSEEIEEDSGISEEDRA